jgi:hypothetical protein
MGVALRYGRMIANLTAEKCKCISTLIRGYEVFGTHRPHTRYLRDLLRERNLFVSLNQGTLLEALGHNLAEEPKELVEV